MRYGPKTQLGVRRFQEKYKLADIATINDINGRWIGPSTRKELTKIYS